jgi:hypothetical protein
MQLTQAINTNSVAQKRTFIFLSACTFFSKRYGTEYAKKDCCWLYSKHYGTNYAKKIAVGAVTV